MSTTVPGYFTRSEGKLSYPELMKVVEATWKQVDGGQVPLYSFGVTREEVVFPCILFNLTDRRVSEEIKPKVREIVTLQDGRTVRMRGQRFLDTVTFIVCTDGDPELADLLAEAWEEFMLEYTGTFMRLGVSQITYGRRKKAALDTSWGENVVTRWIDYDVITEKIYADDQEKLDEIAFVVRQKIEGYVGDERLESLLTEAAVAREITDTGWYPSQSAPGSGVVSEGWAVANLTLDKEMDSNATTLHEVADVLGTLIDALIESGLLAEKAE